MTLAEKTKTLDKKIKANKTQYNLYRKAVKISAMSSGNLDKHEHLTGQDLAPKPAAIEQKEFEYSPLGQIFNKEKILEAKIRNKTNK